MLFPNFSTDSSSRKRVERKVEGGEQQKRPMLTKAYDSVARRNPDLARRNPDNERRNPVLSAT